MHVIFGNIFKRVVATPRVVAYLDLKIYGFIQHDVQSKHANIYHLSISQGLCDSPSKIAISHIGRIHWYLQLIW